MLLAVDIGNTNISYGIFKGPRLIKQFDIPSKAYSRSRLEKKLKNSPKISVSIICGVVPKLTNVISHDLKLLTAKTPYIIGKELIVPIKNNYRCPNQVGQDRLVNAYAGVRLYGYPLIVADFGTAITFDVISKSGRYEGGLILPGLEISIDALYHKTALLPKIKLNKPKEFIGRDTRSSMVSGLVYGFSSMAEELNNKFKKKLGRQTRIIATGGNAGLIRRYCNNINHIDSLLTLKGIYLISKNIK